MSLSYLQKCYILNVIRKEGIIVNTSIEKLVKYLKELQEKEIKSKRVVNFMSVGKNLTDLKVKKYVSRKSERELELEFIIPRITMSDEEYLDKLEIFQHFKDLSKYIEEAHLQDFEVLDIIMYMIRRNLGCIVVANETIVIDYSVLRKFKLPNISTKEIASLIESGRINIILNSADKDLTPSEIYIRDAIIEYSSNYSINIKELNDEHMNIKAHYFDKIDSYDIDDIASIVSSLKELTLSDKLCQSIKRALTASLNRRMKSTIQDASRNESVSLAPYKTNQSEVSEETPQIEEISHKEHKNIYNTIREYYNIPKRKLVREVDYNKMIEIVSLMLKINIDLKSIRTFIRLVLKSLEEGITNPSEKYQTFKAKLANSISQEQMDYLDELYEAFTEDNSLWMNDFMEYLDEVLKQVNEFDTYSYEFEQAKQLLKVENGN